METWNNLVDKFDLLLTKVKFDSTVKIAGREISPLVMGFALIVVCIAIWGYLEFEGNNKLIGALVSVLMAWGVAQLSAMGWGDGIGEHAAGSTYEETLASGTMSKSTEDSNSTEHSTDASETQPDKERMALFAFAGVIVALFVIYQMRSVDRVEDMNTEFTYSELVEMVEPIQDTIEAALLSGSSRNLLDMDSLDSGVAGLPDEVLVSEEAHGISVIDGQIIATWMTDESKLDGVTYILTPKIEDGEVEWATTGTCGSKKAC